MTMRSNLLIQLLVVGIFGCGKAPAVMESTKRVLGSGSDGATCNKPEGCISEADKQRAAAQIARETEYPASAQLNLGETFEMEYKDLRYPRVRQDFAAWSASDLGFDGKERRSLRLAVGSIRAEGCTLVQNTIALQVGSRYLDLVERSDDQRFDSVAAVGAAPMSLSRAAQYVPWLYIESDRPCTSIHVEISVIVEDEVL